MQNSKTFKLEITPPDKADAIFSLLKQIFNNDNYNEEIHKEGDSYKIEMNQYYLEDLKKEGKTIEGLLSDYLTELKYDDYNIPISVEDDIIKIKVDEQS